MRLPLVLRAGLVAGTFVLAACGGSGTDDVAPEGAGRAIPTEIGDLQADCDRGTAASCEALDDRLGSDLSADDVDDILCGAWGDIQLSESDIAPVADRIMTVAGDDLPPEVVAALQTMSTASGDTVDHARDVVDEHFLTRC